MRPYSVLILFFVMMACTAVGAGEALRMLGVSGTSHFIILAAIGTAATSWFRPRWHAYRKDWEANR
jgi:hypothetical protein